MVAMSMEAGWEIEWQELIAGLWMSFDDIVSIILLCVLVEDVFRTGMTQTPPQRQAKIFTCSLSISRKPQCNFISKLLSRSRKWFNCSGINRWTWWLLTVRSPKLHLRFEDLLSCPRLLLPARARRHIDHASKVLRTPVTTVKAPIMTFTLVSAARLRLRRAARKMSN